MQRIKSGTDYVLKYALDGPTGGQFAIPSGSRFLALQMQAGVPVMWWSAPKGQEAKDWPLRTFTVVSTGPPGYAADQLHYVGTFQDGGFVGHVFCHEPEGL